MTTLITAAKETIKRKALRLFVFVMEIRTAYHSDLIG